MTDEQVFALVDGIIDYYLEYGDDTPPPNRFTVAQLVEDLLVSSGPGIDSGRLGRRFQATTGVKV